MTCYVSEHRRRLLAVRLAGTLNGIDFLEIRDRDEPLPPLRQRTLLVRLLLPVPAAVDATWVEIDGGERIRTVAVEWARRAVDLTAAEQADLVSDLDADQIARTLAVRTEGRGDFSRYRFALVTPGTHDEPTGFDPLLSEVPFSFKVECPTDFDCFATCECPPGVHHPPPIDYLAKDFQGFRRIMLERMSLLAPGWTERSAADLGVTVVELLAAVADELSYRQDAVATEAYLGTARSRVSLARHARLVDYRVHDGCNARVWARILVDPNQPGVVVPAGTVLLTGVPGLPPRLEPDSRDLEAAQEARPVVFRTVERQVVHGDLDELRFWTWGRLDESLPPAATSATLRGHHPALRAGEVIVLAETVSPMTREPEDADPTRRFAVRLVEVRRSTNPAGALFPDGTEDVTEIVWHPDDALPASLCLVSGGVETAHAWGNLVLADHGDLVGSEAGWAGIVLAPDGTVVGEELGIVPASHLSRAADGCDEGRVPIPARFRPTLSRMPLTRALAEPRAVLVEAPLTAAMAAELDAGAAGDEVQALFRTIDETVPDGALVTGVGALRALSSGGRAWLLREEPPDTIQVLDEAPAATTTLAPDPRGARPELHVVGQGPDGEAEWGARMDLLTSDRADRGFVVETEHDGSVFLRFGDDEHGQRTVQGTRFTAVYRVGNGVAGNIGRDSLTHVVAAEASIFGVANPMAAAGGVEPESGHQIRRDAPATLAVQERAVTAADYAVKAELTREVSRAEASFRWTGSWHTVFVTADRAGGGPVDADFEREVRAGLERYRMAGYDLEVDAPVFVPIDLALVVCVRRGFHRAVVSPVVRDALRAVFDPDRVTFGQPVHLSSVLAAAHAVDGVESVDVLRFERQHRPETSGIEDGVLPIGRLEIAQLDDDANFPERGVLHLEFGGGS